MIVWLLDLVLFFRRVWQLECMYLWAPLLPFDLAVDFAHHIICCSIVDFAVCRPCYIVAPCLLHV